MPYTDHRGMPGITWPRYSGVRTEELLCTNRLPERQTATRSWRDKEIRRVVRKACRQGRTTRKFSFLRSKHSVAQETFR